MTYSADFPTVHPVGSFIAGTHEQSYVSVIDSVGALLLFSTFLSGTGGADVAAIAVDSNQRLYVTGGTAATDYPTTANAFQAANAGGAADVFVTQLTDVMPDLAGWIPPDLAAPPDLEVPPDLAQPDLAISDQAAAPDLAPSPDLGPSPDLSMKPDDLGVPRDIGPNDDMYADPDAAITDGGAADLSEGTIIPPPGAGRGCACNISGRAADQSGPVAHVALAVMGVFIRRRRSLTR